MIKSLKAKFKDGVIVPMEPLDFEEGEEIIITVDVKTSPSREERRKRTMSAAGGWKGKVDGRKLKKDIYASRRINTRPGPRDVTP